VQITGAHRLSRQYGDWIAEVDATSQSVKLDYSLDLPGDPAPVFCTGEQWQFERRGIPSALITTGTHAESRTVKDDIETIDFAKLARLTEFIRAVAVDIANRPARPALDKPRPDPGDRCQ
jgi:hypothetical protein